MILSGQGLEFKIPFRPRPFANQLLFDHLKSGHVRISDPHSTPDKFPLKKDIPLKLFF